MAKENVLKKDKVTSIIRIHGPILPITISKNLNVSTTYAGAILSEMVGTGELKITSVKKGGSPFYYLPEQESQLQNLIINLNEKDQQTVNLLKKKGILRDRDLTPLTRVSLRQIKDYAKEIQVRTRANVDIFWKWYLLNDEKVKVLVGDYLKQKYGEEEKTEEKAKTKKEETQVKLVEVKKTDVLKEPFKKEFKEKEEPIEGVLTEKEEELAKKAEKKESFTKEYKENLEPLERFFMENEIEILKQDIIKKDKEINYLIEMNMKIGKGMFFLKYRNKRKINEADLSLALHEAGRLPMIFLTTGELNKKAEEMLKKEFKGVIFRKL